MLSDANSTYIKQAESDQAHMTRNCELKELHQRESTDFYRTQAYMAMKSWIGVDFLPPMRIVHGMVRVDWIGVGPLEAFVCTCNLEWH